MAQQLTTPDDAMDAAVPALSPRFVLEMLEDPDAANAWCRVNAVLQYQGLIDHTSDPEFTPALRLKLAESLAKMGGLVRDKTVSAASSDRPLVNIVFSGDSERSVTVTPYTDETNG